MKKITLLSLAFFMLLTGFSHGQVNSNIQTPISINDDGSDPDASAILDIKSTTRGILIPRLTKPERDALSNPADGLLIFDTNESAFFFYFGTNWIRVSDELSDTDNSPINELLQNAEINGNNLELTDAGGTISVGLGNLILPVLRDNDNDTKVQVEENADDDIIRFDLEGEEEAIFTKNANGDFIMEVPGSNNNVFLGTNAGNANTNPDTNFPNTFVGHNAGTSNTLGLANAFFGDDAGNKNTTGFSNTFIGSSAGFSNTTGNFNVFIGQSAGITNTLGSGNTFIGEASGQFNTEGECNTFLGENAGASNTTSDDNTFVGWRAGATNTGNWNTFVGKEAGYDNTSGQLNTFLGRKAGFDNTTGNWNTFVGAGAGDGNMTGDYNTFIGENAGFNVETGNKNIYIGQGAGGNNTSGSSNVFIGYNAGIFNTASNRLFIHNTNSNTPLIYGEFDNSMFRVNGELQVGNERIVDGGSLNLGIYADVIPGDGALPYDVGNNIANESWDDVVGDDFVNVSDARRKRDIKSLNYGLKEILQLNPVSYNYLHEPDFAPASPGLIAQEVLEIVPEIVKTHEIDVDESGQVTQTPVDFYGVNYVELIPVLIKGMQEQQDKIKDLEYKLQQVMKALAKAEITIE